MPETLNHANPNTEMPPDPFATEQDIRALEAELGMPVGGNGDAILESLEQRLNLKPEVDPATGDITAEEPKVAAAGVAAAAEAGATGGKTAEAEPTAAPAPEKTDAEKAAEAEAAKIAEMHTTFWDKLPDDKKAAWQKNEISWSEKSKMLKIYAADFLGKPELDPRSPLERAAAEGDLRLGWSEEANVTEETPADPQAVSAAMSGPGHKWNAASMKIDMPNKPRRSMKDRFMAHRARRVNRGLNTPKIDSLDLTSGRTFEAPVQPVVAETTPVVAAAEETEPVEPLLNTPKIDALDLTRNPNTPRPSAEDAAAAMVKANRSRIDALDITSHRDFSAVQPKPSRWSPDARTTSPSAPGSV